ncbi:TolC family protein [Flavobacterium sp. HSC-61S13]|uniref:TolC family protein n=1 Tax=Flavobacterium sp. HSC-61S13 TaxID=2910963 RepID=UPI00209F701D|nr:TolC family protein [Flavobacterium sp. HSC-61S13]MCP1996247.1 outer membrane protein TolC [Flavobacterium sp. HSC-61S13]
MKYLLSTITLFLLGIQMGFAQAPPALLTLEEALSQTLENNFDIQLAANNLKINEANVYRGNAGMLPSLALVANSNDNFTNTTQTQSDGSSRELNNSKNNSLNYGAALNWTLFDGFKMFAKYDELKQTQVQGQKLLQIKILEKVNEVYTVYYDLVQQQKLFTALDTAVVISKQRLEIAENRYQIGKASKLEVLNAKVDLNTDITTLTRQKEYYYNTKVRLNRVISRDTFKLDFIVESNVAINWDLKLVDLLLQLDAQNPDLQLAIINADIAQLQYKQLRADRYPTLLLNSGYTFSESESSLGFVSKSSGRGWNYGFTARLNLFDGQRQSQKEKIARFEIDNAQILIERQRQYIESELMMAFQTYSTNLELVNLEGKNEEIAKQNLEITLDKFEIGTISTLEFRTAQLNYVNAVVRNNNAQYQAKLSEVILKVLVGKLDI